MRDSVTVLCFPRDAAVGGGDDGAESANGPSVQWIVGRKRNAEKMVPGSRGPTNPFFAGVYRRQDNTARARNNGARLIFYINTVERRIRGRRLLSPFEAAINAPEYRAIGPDGPAMPFVFRKADRIDHVPLRSRVLPFPATQFSLCAGDPIATE